MNCNIIDYKQQLDSILQNIILEYNQQSSNYTQQLSDFNLSIQDKQNEIDSYISTIKEKDSYISKIETENKNLRKQSHEYEDIINNSQKKIQELQEESDETQRFDIIRNQAKELENKDSIIQRLETTIQSLKKKGKKDPNTIEQKINNIQKYLQETIEEKGENKDGEKDEEKDEEKGEEKDEEKDGNNTDDTEPLSDDDDDMYTIITYRKKDYYIIDDEEPQYIYSINTKEKIGEYITKKNGKKGVKIYKK
tara:strand:- start:8983 stop:9735 length:753 start_codon:yes stop_codon:yes gene_type:complete